VRSLNLFYIFPFVGVDIFRNYFRDNAAAFIDAPEILAGEHNLEYYGLFQKYLKVYEVGDVNVLSCVS
jgi:hypothetical protein